MKNPFAAPVICGVDFSQDSARALAFARSFSVRLGCPLTAVAAAEPLLAEAADAKYGEGQFLEQAQEDLRAFTDPIAPDATLLVEVGEASRVLLAAAVAAHAGLVVVGTRGLGRTARALLGSTTLRLMRSTDRPVLAIPPAEHEDTPALDASETNRVVCGVDFSDASLVAARAAVALGEALSVPVTLLHAVPRVLVPAAWATLLAEAEAAREHDAQVRLQELAAGFTPPPDARARTGPAAEILAEEAGAEAHALVVMGIRGAGRHRPGSTALRVLTTARVPVLAVPEN